MKDRNIPWGIHRISNIYHPDVQAGIPDIESKTGRTRWVTAVGEPYTANRLVAAWWVLTGRAYALLWPKAGDLEDIWRRRAPIDKTKNRPLPTGPAGDHGQVGWMGGEFDRP